MNAYLKMGIMLIISFVIMYTVMFLNVDQADHIMLSNTRTYMSILMVAPMALLMLMLMSSMFENKKLNILIAIAAIVIFSSVLYMLRSQSLIKDEQYMKAMISHHSSAIMVSQKATLEDPETIQLAKEIIEAQRREIAQMKKILYRLDNGNDQDD